MSAKDRSKEGSMKAITANRLRDGEVVFLGEGGRWVESFAEAALFQRSEADAVLADAKATAEREQFGVDIYAFEVVEEDGVRSRRRCASGSAPPARPSVWIWASRPPEWLFE